MCLCCFCARVGARDVVSSFSQGPLVSRDQGRTHRGGFARAPIQHQPRRYARVEGGDREKRGWFEGWFEGGRGGGARQERSFELILLLPL
jgi:hypothetical protein